MNKIVKPQRKTSKYSKLFYLALPLLLLFTVNAAAQHRGPKELSPAKGIHETYTRYETPVGLIYLNSRYNYEAIRAEYPEIGAFDGVEGTFRIRVESNERLLKSVKSAFSQLI